MNPTSLTRSRPTAKNTELNHVSKGKTTLYHREDGFHKVMAKMRQLFKQNSKHRVNYPI